jgi:hypothetical protein
MPQSAVRVFPHDGMWFVGAGAGYYNYPLSRAEAIRKAITIASTRGEEVQIEVQDERGNVLDVISAGGAANTGNRTITPRPRDESTGLFHYLSHALWPHT